MIYVYIAFVSVIYVAQLKCIGIIISFMFAIIAFHLLFLTCGLVFVQLHYLFHLFTFDFKLLDYFSCVVYFGPSSL